ncbi:MAG: hypothetical protein UZ21_OP11001001007 [Microgenomates bacterium OLB22]|nr:MAG: hypothetical protein UZ21_OP11001001007 [Microgenomates bacterium OLB22]
MRSGLVTDRTKGQEVLRVARQPPEGKRPSIRGGPLARLHLKEKIGVVRKLGTLGYFEELIRDPEPLLAKASEGRGKFEMTLLFSLALIYLLVLSKYIELIDSIDPLALRPCSGQAIDRSLRRTKSTGILLSLSF